MQYFKSKNDYVFKIIFCNENNQELIKKNICVKGKTLDVLVETEFGGINIKVNLY